MGAMYLSNPDLSDQSPYATVQEAVLVAASDLSPPPTVAIRDGIDKLGDRYYEVTVSHTLSLCSRIIGAPQTITVTRSVRARMYPSAVLEKEA